MTIGMLAFGFWQGPLGTATTAGFVGPATPPLFCTSQAQVDLLCQSVPLFCGKTCTLVPGSAYDPSSGRVNLVGPEHQSGCDGSVCQGPIEMFSGLGDLRLTDADPRPLGWRSYLLTRLADDWDVDGDAEVAWFELDHASDASRRLQTRPALALA